MRNYLPLLCAIFFFGISHAQVPTSSELYKTLKFNDSLLFDVGFNTCNLNAFENLLAEDLEFYHDKSGITETKAAFISSFKKGICGNPNFKSRRELLPETLEVFPLYNNGILYGALQKGVHRFFESMDGKPETKGSTAMFTHLWLLQETGWKIKRVLSYNHQIIPHENNTEIIILSESVLDSFTGSYRAPQSGLVLITSTTKNLIMKAEGMELSIFPSTETVFFSKEAPLSFKFVKDSKGQTTKLIVFENGKKVEEAIKE